MEEPGQHLGSAHNCFDQKFPVSFGGGDKTDALGGYAFDKTGNSYLCGRTVDSEWA